jgi:hypothetical protein
MAAQADMSLMPDSAGGLPVSQAACPACPKFPYFPLVSYVINTTPADAFPLHNTGETLSNRLEAAGLTWRVYWFEFPSSGHPSSGPFRISRRPCAAVATGFTPGGWSRRRYCVDT